MCGHWYLPMFLFRDRSLTLMKMTTLIDQAMIHSSLPTMLMFSTDVVVPGAVGIICRSAGLVVFDLGPNRVLEILKCLLQVVFLLLKQMWAGIDSLFSLCQGGSYIKFGS